MSAGSLVDLTLIGKLFQMQNIDRTADWLSTDPNDGGGEK